MNTRTQLRLTAVIAILVATGVANPAVASGTLDRMKVSVSYGDLDIHSPSGAQLLYSRLKRASSTVCGLDDAERSRTLSTIASAKACFEKTLDKAVAKVDSSALKKLHVG
jgi:UrcA family protein